MLWIVDPIDGTKNFLHGSVHCSVSIAVALDWVPVVAVVAAPLLGAPFWAVRGHGSFRGDRRLQVSKVQDLRRSLVTYDVNITVYL